jgi:hypothetical protein
MSCNGWKAVALALAAYAALSADTSGQKLSKADVVRGRNYLEEVRSGVVEATKGLSEAQWIFKPAADRWSAAEIVEHIVLVQEYILGPVREQLAKAHAGPDGFDARKVDAIIVNQLPDRSSKFRAPDPLRPTGRWTPAAALERLNDNTRRLTEYLESTPDLRLHFVDAPPLEALTKGQYKSMDGYEWLLAAGAHTERHTKQILEVKNDSKFPR